METMGVPIADDNRPATTYLLPLLTSEFDREFNELQDEDAPQPCSDKATRSNAQRFLACNDKTRSPPWNSNGHSNNISDAPHSQFNSLTADSKGTTWPPKGATDMGRRLVEQLITTTNQSL